MAALGALGSVEFDDEFLTAFEQSGQAGTVPAGALDRPHSQCAVLVGEVHQILVAIDSGRHGDLAENSAGAGGDRRSGVGVDVGVDSDDDVDDVSQNGHAFLH
ncbi:hypothetical protein Rruber_05310 (plasmid) [Rhodococcus ruber]